LAGKILQAELRPDRHRQLIQQALAQWHTTQTPGPWQTAPSSGQEQTTQTTRQGQTAQPIPPSESSPPFVRRPGVQAGSGDSPPLHEEPRG
jgi:hypothetical protein